MNSNTIHNCSQRRHSRSCLTNFWHIWGNEESNLSLNQMFRDSSFNSNWACAKLCSQASCQGTSCRRKRNFCNKLSRWATICSRCKIFSIRGDLSSWVWTLSSPIFRIPTTDVCSSSLHKAKSWCLLKWFRRKLWFNRLNNSNNNHRECPNSSSTNSPSLAMPTHNHLRWTKSTVRTWWCKRSAPKCKTNFSSKLRLRAISILTQTSPETPEMNDSSFVS